MFLNGGTNSRNSLLPARGKANGILLFFEYQACSESYLPKSGFFVGHNGIIQVL
jgi:hypothetical protein